MFEFCVKFGKTSPDGEDPQELFHIHVMGVSVSDATATAAVCAARENVSLVGTDFAEARVIVDLPPAFAAEVEQRRQELHPGTTAVPAAPSPHLH